MRAELWLCDSDGRYGRRKRVWVQSADDVDEDGDMHACDGCGASVRLLCADASDDEYSPVRLCMACIARAIGQFNAMCREEP